MLSLSIVFLKEDFENSQEYLLAMQDKHKRAQNIKGTKIILAGGSNLVFGIDSEQIQKELHTPVVNFGLHAQLGLSFILNEVQDIAKPNDIVILSIEHLMPTEGDPELQKITSYYNPSAYSYSSQKKTGWLEKFKKISGNHQMLFKKTISNFIEKKEPDQVYRRDAFNRFGDGINHLELPSKTLGSRSILKERSYKQIELFNRFYKFALDRGIRVVFTYGAYEQSEYQKNKKVLQENHKILKQHLKIEMIMDIDDFVYPTPYFYDSVYHLNKIGRVEHTKNLIQKIQNCATLAHLNNERKNTHNRNIESTSQKNQ